MSEPPTGDRMFSRDQAALILREAAAFEPSVSRRDAPRLGAGDDALSLGEIQRAALEVGIAPNAVATASLRVALESTAGSGDRTHHVHTVSGALSGQAWEQLAAELRSLVRPTDVRRTADGIELELKKANGELGSLLVHIRDVGGSTRMEIWGEGPSSRRGDLVGFAAIGMPVAVFPVVAVSAGQWPALAPAAALAAAGALAGASIGLLWQSRSAARWRARMEELLLPTATLVAQLAEPSPSSSPSSSPDSSSDSSPRADL